MAKKRISRTRKRQLEQPDEFLTLSSRAIEYARGNSAKILSIIGIILFFFVATVGIRYYSEQTEDKAFVRLAKILSGYQEVMEKQGEEKAFQDMEKDFGQFLDKYSGKEAAKFASVYFADIYYNAGNYDKAIELYGNAMNYFDKDNSLKNLLLSGLGYCCEAKKDYKTAAKYFEMIISGHEPVLQDEAYFNLGRLYSAIGEGDKSQDAFKKVINEYKDFIYFDLVKEKLSE